MVDLDLHVTNICNVYFRQIFNSHISPEYSIETNQNLLFPVSIVVECSCSNLWTLEQLDSNWISELK